MARCSDCVSFCRAIKTASGYHVLRDFSEAELFDLLHQSKEPGVCRIKFNNRQDSLFPVAHSRVSLSDSCVFFKSHSRFANNG